jgi:hypothetical protein
MYDPINIKVLFNVAKKIYRQTPQNFYMSVKNLLGLHLAVLPHQYETIFSTYNYGDDHDVRHLNNLWHKENIFKTFGCTLCAIDQYDNEVIISDTQNQLYLDPNTPLLQLQTFWQNQNRKYIITATTPEYYSHLMFLSEDHVPIYGIFVDKLLFSDLYTYLLQTFQYEPNVVALFNGNLEDDPYHFRVHLTNQSFVAVEYAIKIIEQSIGDALQPVLYYNNVNIDYSLIRYLLLYSSNLNLLYDEALKIVSKHLLSKEYLNKIVLTANFLYRTINGNGIYILLLHRIDQNSISQEIDNCKYTISPSGYLLNASCFNIPENEFDFFKIKIGQQFNNVYLPFDSQQINRIFNKKNIYYTTQLIIANINLRTLEDSTIEQIYATTQHFIRNPTYRPIYSEFIKDLQDILVAGNECLISVCSKDFDAKYRYLLGLFITSLTASDLNRFFNSIDIGRIYANIKYLRSYNGSNNQEMVQSDYLYFRGTFLAKLLRQTFNNLLLVTYDRKHIERQTIGINKWLKFIFEPIGEESAFGINTISKLYNMPKIDFIMKITLLVDLEKLKTGIVEFLPNKLIEFNHELMVSLQVNNLRDYVPNYIICYGGFTCDSSDIEHLCNSTIGQIYSYILLENVKNSQTLRRKIQTPQLSYPQEVNDIVDIIYQIIVALMYGYKLMHFTHGDLHLNNIMEYNFIQNKNYLKLFKIYNEDRGDIVPKINKILFRYYIEIQDKIISLLVPAKYLYLIIDYGRVYIDGIPNIITQPNSVSDIYIFLSNLLTNIINYRPYLIFDESTGEWLNNNLSKIYTVFFEAYKDLFNTDYKIILQTLSRMTLIGRYNRYITYHNYLISIIKDEYKQPQFHHISPSFMETNVHSNFRGAEKVVLWLYMNIYKEQKLEQYLDDPDVYIFNWGGEFLKHGAQEGTLSGIEPNKEIQHLIQNRKNNQSYQITRVQNFTQTL